AEEDALRLARLWPEPWSEMLEDVELRVERLGGVQIEAVAALPAERPAAHLLQPVQIHSALAQEVQLGERKILAHHADHGHLRQEAGRRREIGGASAQHVVALAERRLDRVERH